MVKYLSIISCVFIFFSCKKDTVEPVNIIQLNAGTNGDLNRILIEDSNKIHIAGGIMYEQADLLFSEDGGYTWGKSIITEEPLKAVYALTKRGNNIYGVGLDGKMYFRDPTNETWRYHQTWWWDWYKGIAFPADDYCIIVSGRAFEFGILFWVNSQGDIMRADSFNFELNDVVFPSDSIGYICGYGVVLKSTDGGKNWAHTGGKGDLFKTVFCLDEKKVWVVGYNGSILHSRDGGENWIRQRDGNNPLLKKYRLRSIHFINEEIGYACGDKGILLKTKDGGKNWMEVKKFTDNDLHDVKMYSPDKIFVAGAKGTLFMLKD